jgi:GDP-L-fucose synthase
LTFSLEGKRIVVTGGAGFLGSRVVISLRTAGVHDDRIIVPRSAEYDLRERSACDRVVQGADLVIHCAGTVGGIGFNKNHPAEAFYNNAVMGINLIDASYRAGVEKFVGVGSVCSYPKFTEAPFHESQLWEGYPEETNAPYGLAKKMMLVQSEAYRDEYDFNAIHLLMVNLYGPNDNFDDDSSHVVAALIKKFVDAKLRGLPQVTAWGTGTPSREFLYVDDGADAIVAAAIHYAGREPVNIGANSEVTIRELVEITARATDYDGEVIWDTSLPDGQPRRWLDVTRATEEIGWQAKTALADGIAETVDWWRSNSQSVEVSPFGDTV